MDFGMGWHGGEGDYWNQLPTNTEGEPYILLSYLGSLTCI